MIDFHLHIYFTIEFQLHSFSIRFEFINITLNPSGGETIGLVVTRNIYGVNQDYHESFFAIGLIV